MLVGIALVGILFRVLRINALVLHAPQHVILLVSVISKIAINALRTKNLGVKLVLKVKETEPQI